MLLVALLTPVGAGARPPLATGFRSPLRLSAPPPRPAGPHLTLASVSSPPIHARLGRAFVLHTMVVNDGAAAARARVSVRLLRVGSAPVAIGAGTVDVAARSSAALGIGVRLPRVLRDGSYALVACARRGGRTGKLGCVTAERHVRIGAAPRVVRVPTAAAAQAKCSSGAHSLSPFGAHVYPETGNGGYTSLHTDVFLTYDTASNLFLPGTHVVLTDRATQCLTDFSLDFERTSPNTKDGPDLTVGSVLVNGARRASRSSSRPIPAIRTARTIPIRVRTRRVSSIRSAVRRTIRSRPPARRSFFRRTRTSSSTSTAPSVRRTSS